MKTQRIRNIGAAACAILLSLTMVALLAGLGSDEAQAEPSEGDMIVKAAKVEYVSVGWYATVAVSGSVSISDTKTMWVVAGSDARSSSGWIDLGSYGYQVRDGHACIDEASVSALQSAGVLYSSEGAYGDNITWKELFKAVVVPEPLTGPEETEDKGTETTKPPVIDRTSDVTETEKPPVTASDTAKKPAEPTYIDQTAPDSQQPNVADKAETIEPEIFSLKCRTSEVEEKIAELEAQGYEIVNVVKLPKWYR